MSWLETLESYCSYYYYYYHYYYYYYYIVITNFYYRFRTSSMHMLLEIDHASVKRTLTRASELILKIDFKRRVDSSKFFPSTRVTFACAMACSRVTSRNSLSNAIRNTEIFLEDHLSLLNPASARTASNGAF